MNIAFPHKPQKHGGPGSFQLRLEKTLEDKGWNISYFDETDLPDVVMVVGGTKRLWQLIKFRLKGIPVIYRLDGISWLHKKVKVSLWSWFYSEVTNLLSQIIRSYIANSIVYQSKFVAEWWGKKGWHAKAYSTIIHNGVGLATFTPSGNNEPLSILCVEGTLDYSPYAVDLLNILQEKLIAKSEYESLILYGEFRSKENKNRLNNKIEYRGRVARSDLPKVYNNAVYLSLDINAACPNTVIEAMASGLPVIGFDTGALRELVTEEAGEIVPYGSDPWDLGFPDVDGLCRAALKVKKDWHVYAKNARRIAEKRYNHLDIVEKYIQVIEREVGKASR